MHQNNNNKKKQAKKKRTHLQDLAPILGEGRQLVQGVAQHQLHPDLHLRVGGAIVLVLVLVLNWGLCIKVEPNQSEPGTTSAAPPYHPTNL